jgi:hypothetical protein
MLVKPITHKKRGAGGFLNKLIDNLNVELHLPGYNFCGPGTRLEQRLSRGDKGVNALDEACKRHDIAYHNYSDSSNRRQADKLLTKESFKRVISRDASLKERAAALGVAAAMKLKTSLGMGVIKKSTRRRRGKKRVSGSAVSFNTAVGVARKALNLRKPKSMKTAAQLALKALRPYAKRIRRPSRVIPIPKKIGGFIGLASLLAGLSAIGSLAGGASAIAKAATEIKNAKADLSEKKRHNLAMESKSIGSGLVVKRRKTKSGWGFYLKPYQESKNC